jgi:hypothetical protein
VQLFLDLGLLDQHVLDYSFLSLNFQERFIFHSSSVFICRPLSRSHAAVYAFSRVSRDLHLMVWHIPPIHSEA